MKEPKIEFIDDGPGKPVGINRFIGQRPIFAFGNSDGDQQMLEYVAAGDRLGLPRSCITPMQSENGLMIADLLSASSTRPSTKPMRRDGRWWI